MGQEETLCEEVLPEKLSQLRNEDLGQEAISVKQWGPESHEVLLWAQPSIGLTSDFIIYYLCDLGKVT